jgi:hypothetical protein
MLHFSVVEEGKGKIVIIRIMDLMIGENGINA